MTSRASFQNPIPSIEKLQLQLRRQRPAVIWLLLGSLLFTAAAATPRRVSHSQITMNTMKMKTVFSRIRAIPRFHNIRVQIKSCPATATPTHLKWMEPFMDNLNYLHPLITNVSKVVMAGVAVWKFQTSAEVLEKYINEYFGQLKKQTEVDQQRNELLKEIAEIAETHKDLGFFLKHWRKSWDQSEDARARDDGDKDGASK